MTAPDRPAARMLPWLGHRLAYTLGSPLMTVAGSATTIAAPILLDPAQFASLALLTTVFMYAADFDIGLSRLADRELSTRTSKHSLGEFVVARFVICSLLCLISGIAALRFGWMFATAGIAGALFMLAQGPFSFYRARSQTYQFTLTAFLISFGQSLPRFVGLLAGGVEGMLLGMLLWYSATAAIVNKPFLGMLTSGASQYRCRILKDAVPLFAFNYLWVVYLLSNRWFSWSVSSETDAGLFAFGASLLYVGVGVMASIGQAYYPKHLAGTARGPLASELLRVLLAVTAGVALGAVFCRFGVPALFPRFAAAGLSSAVILLSGLPLCLAAWITPVVIARSTHPWRHSGGIFGSSLLLLYASIHAAADYGVVGQSIACLPSAVLLLFCDLFVLRSIGLVEKSDLVTLAGTLAAGLGFCGAVVHGLF